MPKRFIGKLPILQKKDIGQDIYVFLLSNRYHFLILHLTKSALNPKFGNALKICQHLHGLAHGHIYIYIYMLWVWLLCNDYIGIMTKIILFASSLDSSPISLVSWGWAFQCWLLLWFCLSVKNSRICLLICWFSHSYIKIFILYNSSGHHDSLEECLGMLCFHVNDLLFWGYNGVSFS